MDKVLTVLGIAAMVLIFQNVSLGATVGPSYEINEELVLQIKEITNKASLAADITKKVNLSLSENRVELGIDQVVIGPKLASIQ